MEAFQSEQTALLWTIAVPAWLRDFIDYAGASGWRVEQESTAVAFHRPEGPEHTYRVQLPLPEDAHAVDRVRCELQMRLMVVAGGGQ
jgi:hypothetical protein